MNSPGNQRLLSFVGIAGAFLVVAGLVGVMRNSNPPPPLDQNRVAQRKAALAEIRDANMKSLNNYDWQDQGKGLARLTIDHAMALTVADYKNPAAARSNHLARAEKAFFVAPPPPPAPSKYE
jgi:hypothetical protein